jgi:O-antigen/teichoic acid export membrane protein
MFPGASTVPIPTPVAGLWPRAAALLARHRFAVAALDQAALSLAGFALTLGLVRVLSATDFGIVSLWMTVSLFAFGIQNALVNTPLSVYPPGAIDENAKRRLESSLASVNAAALALAALAIVAVDALAAAEWAPKDLPTAAAVPVFVVAGLYREYYRSVAFSRRDMGLLVLVDAPFLAVTGLCLAAMLAWPRQTAGLFPAFAALSLGSLASRVCLHWRRAAKDKLRLFARGWTAAYRPIFGEVRWSFAGVVATHLHGRGYVYIVTGFAGLAALATINVVGVLFRPARTFLTAWGRLALPQLAALHAERRGAEFDRAVWRAFAGALALSLGWTAAVWFAWPLIDRYFLAGKYGDAWLLVLPWALSAGCNCVGYTISTALQAARDFRFLACTTLISAPVTAAAVALMLWRCGYLSAMYGVAFGDALALAMVIARLYALRRRAGAAQPLA